MHISFINGNIKKNQFSTLHYDTEVNMNKRKNIPKLHSLIYNQLPSVLFDFDNICLMEIFVPVERPIELKKLKMYASIIQIKITLRKTKQKRLLFLAVIVIK